MPLPKLIKNTLKGFLTEEQYKKAQVKYRAYAYRERVTKRINDFHENFRVIMEEKKLYVKYDKTITPYNIKALDGGGADGIVCDLAFPPGLSINDLDKVKYPLAQGVYGKCMVFIEDELGKPVRFSAIKDWHNLKYEPVLEVNNKKLTASQVFVGYNIRLEPIVIDLANNPHLMITGGSGGGKDLPA